MTKRTEFRVATRTGFETRKGYVRGDFATHRDRGDYFWTFTHLPTGYSLTVYPPHETKASALAHLEQLDRDGLPDRQQSTVERVLRSRTRCECGGRS